MTHGRTGRWAWHSLSSAVVGSAISPSAAIAVRMIGRVTLNFVHVGRTTWMDGWMDGWMDTYTWEVVIEVLIDRSLPVSLFPKLKRKNYFFACGNGM